MLESMLAALGAITTGTHLLFLLTGVAMGLAVGIFPGLGGIVGLPLVVIGLAMFAVPEIVDLPARQIGCGLDPHRHHDRQRRRLYHRAFLAYGSQLPGRRAPILCGSPLAA